MNLPSKKSHLVESLQALIPVWEEAERLCMLVRHPDFPDEEADALSAILQDAVKQVKTEGRIENLRQLNGRVNEMLEQERLLKHHEDQASNSLLSSL